MALDPTAEAEAEARAQAVHSEVGHPEEHWQALRDRIQAQAVKAFADVADEWLAIAWCLDQYRIAQAPPAGMGKADQEWGKRLEAAYRGKGNWFATLMALLLDNRTGQRIRSRKGVQGFSQEHQIDLAWPDRKVDPLVCAESKVSGAPAYGDTRARDARDDFSNRRKELKFAATDLKLARRHHEESIGHWDIWRRNAPPKAYVLWAARMGPGDRIDRMVREAEALVATYLDGAGLFAWRLNESEDGYEPVALPASARVTKLDDVLWQIQSEIRALAPTGTPPEPAPASTPVEPTELAPDTDTD